MYLIMKCDPWGYEYDSMPIAFVKKWKKWFKENQPQYYFEVWEWKNGKFILEKDAETPVEQGMAFYFWEKGHWNYDEMPTVMRKWAGATRKDAVPEDILTFAMHHREDEEALMRELHGGGGFGWEDDEGNWWVYGEYRDHRYDSGF